VGRRIRKPEARQQADGHRHSITILGIFLILYTMFRSYKWATLILVSVIMASIGGPFALYLTHTNFSVSSAVGFLALCLESR
jgi:Cu/Ag efflux pump CusA